MFHLPAYIPLFEWAAQSGGQYDPSPLSFARFPSLFGFFKWADATWICNYIKGTTWIFPLVETIHILSIVVLLGSVLLVDFRSIGLGLRAWTAKEMTRQLRPYIKYGLIVVLVTGFLLFIAEPRKLYDNAAFGPKMLLLLLSIVYQYTIFRAVSRTDRESAPILTRVGALGSLALWFGVGIAGRAIGFV
jgi:hypothetical protein